MLLLTFSLAMAGCSSEEKTATEPTTYTNATEPTLQPAGFSSNDWKSWEFAVNGKVFTLPCKLGDFLDADLKFMVKKSDLKNKDKSYATWYVYKEGNSGNLTALQSYDSGLSSFDKFEISHFSTAYNEDEGIPFEVTIPGNLTWGASNLNEAVSIYGQYDETSEVKSANRTGYFWYGDPSNKESSGYLWLSCNNDTGVIEFISLSHPNANSD